jgi:sortase (surface protein transpeptidase)
MSRGLRRFLAGVAAVGLVVGCARSGTTQPVRPPAATSSTSGPVANGAEAANGFRSARDYRATPVPSRITIPKIGVASRLGPLGRAPDGTVEVPDRWEVAGWYAPGPRPGDPGSAVILGHVDSKRGPAVFFRLRELRPGDEIEVTRADGSVVRFVVERTGQYDKQRFPTDDVYYPTLRSTLRLVTCGGQFDDTAGHYRSNIIVFAAIKT